MTALAGNYVNFGVFELYGDRALSDALDAALNDDIVNSFVWYIGLSEGMQTYFLPYIIRYIPCSSNYICNCMVIATTNSNQKIEKTECIINTLKINQCGSFEEEEENTKPL